MYSMQEQPPTQDINAQTHYWCNMLGITTEQLSKMSDEEMEQRIQAFQRNYRTAKNPDNRHAAFQTMKEPGGTPAYASPRHRLTPKNTPRFKEEDVQIPIPKSPRFESPDRSARRASAKKAAAAKVQKQLQEESAMEAKEKRDRFQQMKMMQEKQAMYQKQMRDQEIHNQQMQNEMVRRNQLRQNAHQEEVYAAQQKQKMVERQRAQSPERMNRSPSPQHRRQPSPSRQQQHQQQQQQQQKLYEEQQKKLYEEQQQKLYEQQRLYEEQQRQNQINEALERQRYLKKLEAEKQKLYAMQLQKHKKSQMEKQRLYEEQQRQIVEDQLRVQQEQEAEYQSEELPSQEEDAEATEATEVEDADINENDYDEDGRLEGGLETGDDDEYDGTARQRGGGGRDMWDIFSSAADNIENRYGQPAGPKASSYPPGKATYRIKGVDVNKNTFDLNASYDGPSNQINYQNRIFRASQNQAGGQDYIDEYEDDQDYERGGQDYEACGYDQTSADDLDDEQDFDDVGPAPRPDYMQLDPRTRTVTSYQCEYSEDAIDESEHNVTVENDGDKQVTRITSRSFLGSIPPSRPECGSEYDQGGYNAYNPYANDLGGTIQRNVRTNAGGKTTELRRVTNQRDGTVRTAHHVTKTDNFGRVRRTNNVDVSPR